MIKSINTVRSLAIDSIQKANSGHPGICMGAAPMAYTLFNHQMNLNPSNPNWINRDRFVLSAGHGSALLYSLLHLSGFDLTIEDLKNFRQIDSKTPGHPENFMTQGIDASTGPLGQGIAMSVGFAMAQRYLASKVNQENLNIIDHNTFVLCGDGDLMEGISYEACSLAGHLKLSKLVVLYDSNDISLDGELNLSFSENVEQRFKSMNWNYIKVLDGEDTKAINSAIEAAKVSDKPTLIEVKTIIGQGADKKAGTSAAHGAPLGEEELTFAKNNYGVSLEPFNVEDEVYNDFKENLQKRGLEANKEWDKKVEELKANYPKAYELLVQAMSGEYKNINIKAYNEEVATRISSQHAINQIAELDELFLGGSADLSGSNNTTIKTDGKFIIDGDDQRNIYFGVREFAMGAINNGMALHSGLNTFTSTFMVFSDYLKPAIRLSALMGIGNTYVFTHDSVAVGEDGPTHQPVEQIAMFRSLPNLNLFRPADANETQAAWYLAHQSTKTPSVIACTRQNLTPISNPSLDKTIENVSKGAYVLTGDNSADKVIVATGSEVKLALDVAEILKENDINVKVVSMPCQELFDIQDNDYKNEVLPQNIETYAIEMLSPFGWEKYTRNSNNIISVNSFGYSGNVVDVMKKIGFEADVIASKILKG